VTINVKKRGIFFRDTISTSKDRKLNSRNYE